MKKLLAAAVATTAMALATTAIAVPVTFDLSSDSHVSIDSFWCLGLGCSVTPTLNSNLGSLSKELSAGESWSFDFFSLDIGGLGIGQGTLSAALGFDSPTSAPDAIGGAFGEFIAGFFVTLGELVWTTQPGNFLLGDGTSYSVHFENIKGIALGNQIDVKARLTLNSEPTGTVAVPEPGTLALLGLGLLGIGFAARRRGLKQS